MPFSQSSEKHTEQYWTAHYKEFLKPLIEECPQLEAARSKPLRGDILKEIITKLVSSPIAVADLTDLNPNVFWELGVRQSFKQGTVTIAQEGTKLPFDVSLKATLPYHDSHIGNEEFSRDFKMAVTSCLDSPVSPDSSVLETLSGRGTLFEIIHQSEILRRLDALLFECDCNDYLLSTVLERCKKNKEKPLDKHWVTSRFTSATVELLIVNRYLDEDNSFYITIATCFTSILALNEMLRNWHVNDKIAEKWFEENGPMYIERFKNHKKAILAAQEKIVTRYATTVL